MAVASLVLGICSIVFDFILWWLGLILGIVGLILAILARKQNPADGKATGGLVCSIIGLALGLVMLAACVACVGALNGARDEVRLYGELNDLFR